MLPAQWNVFVFPRGENAASRIARVSLTENGKTRRSPDARRIPLTPEETIEARQSGSAWQAHFGTGRAGGSSTHGRVRRTSFSRAGH